MIFEKILATNSKEFSKMYYINELFRHVYPNCSLIVFHQLLFNPWKKCVIQKSKLIIAFLLKNWKLNKKTHWLWYFRTVEWFSRESQFYEVDCTRNKRFCFRNFLIFNCMTWFLFVLSVLLSIFFPFFGRLTSEKLREPCFAFHCTRNNKTANKPC